jgi:hypothetical protein
VVYLQFSLVIIGCSSDEQKPECFVPLSKNMYYEISILSNQYNITFFFSVLSSLNITISSYLNLGKIHYRVSKVHVFVSVASKVTCSF